MKICYLISQYPARSHTFILNEIAALRSKGIDIHTASINAPDRPLDSLTEPEQQEAKQTFYIKDQGILGVMSAFFYTLFFHPIGTAKGFYRCVALNGWNIGGLFYHFFYLAEAMILGRWLEKNGIHHIHVHFGIAVSTVALLCKEIFPVNFSMTIHGPDEFYNVTEYHVAEKIKEAVFIICISYFAQSQLMRFSPPELWGKIHVVPLGVSTEEFRAQPVRKNPQPFELMTVGRLVPMKGQAILLAAAAQLIKKGIPLKVTIIGGGPEKTVLEKESKRLGIEDQITLTGPLNFPQVRELYQQSDLFVMSSFSEGVPIVLMEAMAFGIPCIATNVNGIPELIREGVEGLLVPPSDSASLADRIESLINSAQKREELSQAGRQRVIEKYNIKINTEKLANVINRYLY